MEKETMVHVYMKTLFSLNTKGNPAITKTWVNVEEELSEVRYRETSNTQLHLYVIYMYIMCVSMPCVYIYILCVYTYMHMSNTYQWRCFA